MFCSGTCARKFRRRQSAAERREKVTAEQVMQTVAIKEMNAPDSQFLRADEAAKYLGVSKRTVHKGGAKGIIQKILVKYIFNIAYYKPSVMNTTISF